MKCECGSEKFIKLIWARLKENGEEEIISITRKCVECDKLLEEKKEGKDE